MNQHSPTESPASTNLAPDAISRRAYELWESEGRPEGCDMRHWLQAEQELMSVRASQNNRSSAAVPSRNSDVTPLQGTRAAAAQAANSAGASAGREGKRAAATPSAPVATEKNGASGGQNARRKPASAPAL